MDIIGHIEKMAKTADVKKIDEHIDKYFDFLNGNDDETIEYHCESEKKNVSKKFVTDILKKVLNEKTHENKQNYLAQLKKSLVVERTSKYNDINLNRWQEYEQLLTDSLWVIKSRDKSGTHKGDYWGNFIPQIPNQLFQRYTKKNEWILDPFLGSGTSAIEAKRLSRNAIGIELQDNIADIAEKRVAEETGETQYYILKGNSRNYPVEEFLKKKKIKNVQFVIMHPPYWDIIKFSDNREDLSNAKTIEIFLSMLGDVIDNACGVLEKGRFAAIVIGDKYQNGELVPLGFYCMQEFLKRNFLLKSTIVKNFSETKGKSSQERLWRYRALAGGFYIFKHEYIFVFQKK